MSRHLFVFLASSTLAAAAFGCSGSPENVAQGAEDLSADHGTGVSNIAPQCPGAGWIRGLPQTPGASGVHGSYTQQGLPLPGTPATLTVFTDPVTGTGTGDTGGLSPVEYVRTADYLADSGKVTFLTDNPAVGNAVTFYDEAMAQAKDIYAVIGTRRNAVGAISAICMVKEWDAKDGQLESQTPFMLSRMGL